ncbi:MAG TPA: transketolase C-terminal domain-containing protein, partial [Planctomycetota bacterium]|nr:transketolase C-terminal domain-containing protein [Planctomycetota bacterium]
AMAGLRPVAEIMTINFILLAMDQIVNHMAKLRYMSGGQVSVPMVIRSPGGGGLSMGAQHSQSLESFFLHVPGLVVLAPSTPHDAKGLLKSAIRSPNPVIFIEHESIYSTKGDVPDDDYLVPIGQAEVRRQGTDVTIIGHSRMALVAMQAAQELEKEHGVNAEVIDPRTLFPLDRATLTASLKKTGKCVIVQECWPHCSFGSDTAYQLMNEAFDYLDAPIKVLSSENVPFPYSRPLEVAAMPNVDRVVEVVKQIVRG